MLRSMTRKSRRVFGLYLRTLRHLRINQILGRAVLPLKYTSKRTINLGRIQPNFINTKQFISRNKSHYRLGKFQFLNKMVDLGWEPDWKANEQSQLWRYNLHYFDYLLQSDMDINTAQYLMDSWCRANPINSKPGWNSYPTSLRLVNWIKYIWTHRFISKKMIFSMAEQAYYLSHTLEHHLSGNHLIANAKALWMSGVFIGSKAMENKGRKLAISEVDNQILHDGGHYELSPMYHAIVLEDMLDLINMEKSRNRPVPTNLISAASRSRGWLEAIVDENGRIPLLNDSAYSIAIEQSALSNYADSLGVSANKSNIEKGEINEWKCKNISDYYILTTPNWRVIFDAAPLGPDHQPGHAHCDMLGVLLQYRGQDILGDTGVFEYRPGTRRDFCRSTSAHNTVMIDGLEQAEMWKSFRVARRGSVLGPWRNKVSLSASHTGFAVQQKGLSHSRAIIPLSDGIVIADKLMGPGEHTFMAFYHLAPELKIEPLGEGWLVNDQLMLYPYGAKAKLEKSEYYPQFGVCQIGPCIVLEGNFRNKVEFRLICTSYS